MDLREIAKATNKTVLEAEEIMNKVTLELVEMSEKQKKTRLYQSINRVKWHKKPITISLKPSQKRTWDTQRNQREKRSRKKK